MLLMGDGKLQARFDCNRGGGNHKISEGKVSLGPLLSPRMACPPGSLDAPYVRIALSRPRNSGPSRWWTRSHFWV